MDNTNKFKDYIIRNLNKGNSSKRQIIEYLLDINSFKSFRDFKEIISTMVEVEEFQSFYNDKILDLIRAVFIRNEFEPADIKAYIIELYTTGIDPGKKYNFYYALYQKYKYDQKYKFPISEDELKKICFNRLTKFVDSKVKDIDACYNLYYLCREHVDERDNVVLQDRAHKVFRKYIDSYPWDYIDSLIRPYGLPIYHDISCGFTIEPFVEQTFGGWAEFWKFVEKIKEEMKTVSKLERLNKYITFFEKFKDRNYKPVSIPEKDWPLYAIDELIRERNWPIA